MNRLQKIAFINLCLAGLGLMFVLLNIFAGLWIIRVITIIAAFIMSLLMLVTMAFRQVNYIRGGAHFDERDKVIHKTAETIGLGTLFIVLFLSIFISLMFVGFDASITIGNLLSIFLLGMMCVFIADSLSVLIQYSRGQ